MTDAGSMASIERRSAYGGDPFRGNDEKLFVEFVNRPVKDEAASRAAGKSVYNKADYIRIKHRGEKDEIFRPVLDSDKHRFRRQWEAFERGEAVDPEGTPLAILFPDNPEIVEGLKHDRIFTIEQLAGLTDTQIQNIGLGGRQFTDDAKAFLATSKKESRR